MRSTNRKRSGKNRESKHRGTPPSSLVFCFLEDSFPSNLPTVPKRFLAFTTFSADFPVYLVLPLLVAFSPRQHERSGPLISVRCRHLDIPVPILVHWRLDSVRRRILHSDQRDAVADSPSSLSPNDHHFSLP